MTYATSNTTSNTSDTSALVRPALEESPKFLMSLPLPPVGDAVGWFPSALEQNLQAVPELAQFKAQVPLQEELQSSDVQLLTMYGLTRVSSALLLSGIVTESLTELEVSPTVAVSLA